MADATIPGAVYNENPTDIPIDSQPVNFGQGITSNAAAAMRSGLGSSLETQAIGRLQGGGFIPYDQVKKVFDDQKLDATVFPKGQPIRQGEALAVFGQQMAIQADQDRAERAHLGAVAKGVSGFVGALADPLSLGAMVAGPLLGAARAGAAARAVTKGAGFLTRAATGAAEGAAVATGFDVGEKEVGSAQGDRDITTGQILHDAAWGSFLGGAFKGAFGERPSRVDMEPYREMIVGAENTAAYAKAHGLKPEDVVSNKGAVGLYQITPDTAKSLGFNPDMLKDPLYADQVAQANLEKLYKRYGNDPEAIAVGWNAGPGVADKFVKAGHDRAMLPQETRDYLARIDKIKGTGPVAAPGADAPVASVGARDSGLVPARKMPDGSVMYGEKGSTHPELITDAELDGHEPMPNPGDMGWAEPGGAWMSREDAAKLVGSDQSRLESERYKMEQAGEQLPGSFGRRGLPDKTDIDVVKTALAQAEVGSEINVDPVIQAARDEDANTPAYKTNALKIRDEHDDEVRGLETRAYQLARATPRRNSELTPPEATAKLEALNKQTQNAKPEPKVPAEPRAPHPAVAEIQRMAKEDVEAAANMHAGLTGEAPGIEGNKFEKYMEVEGKKFDESEGAEQQPEFQKALEAAVQCGLKNGSA